MQRTSTAGESMQSRSLLSTHKVSHSGRGGAWMGQAHPSSYNFFRPPPPPKLMPPPMGHPPPPTPPPPHPRHLKNKPPPLKRETNFHEMIP